MQIYVSVAENRNEYKNRDLIVKNILLFYKNGCSYENWRYMFDTKWREEG